MTSRRTQIGAFALILLVIAAVAAALIYIASYNGLVSGRNEVTANYQNVLAAYDKFYTNTQLSTQVAKYSVNAQLQLVEITTALRTGNSVNGSGVNINSQVGNLNKIDKLATQFMLTYVAEAYPKIDVSQLTELNGVMESGLTQINHERIIFSNSVAAYNTNLESIPTTWLVGAFHWNFTRLQGYTPTEIHLPEQLANATSLGLNLPGGK